jgi:hypothetical protein
MSNTDVSPEERAARGKRLLIYGMFTVVVVFVVLVFMLTWLFLAPLAVLSLILRSSLPSAGLVGQRLGRLAVFSSRGRIHF